MGPLKSLGPGVIVPPVPPLGGPDIVQCTVYCITSIIQHKSFLKILFKNFEKQVEDFFNVTSDSLVKKLGHPA